MSKSLEIPILFLTYNRLDTVKQSFSRIKEARPKKLYIASDGPKRERKEDAEKVMAVREWIEGEIDWECEVRKRYSAENQGCKYGPANAITWIFETEEEAIILEDDIVADPSFFPYCQEMLQRYKYDTRVMLVSGYKRFWDFPAEEDYFFSYCSPTWGWATWKRAWEYFDITMEQWPKYQKARLLADVYGSDAAISLSENFQLTYMGGLDAWDYPWLFARVLNSGLGILPKYNLIENVGYGEDATHSEGKAPDFHPGTMDMPIKPVKNVVRNWKYDEAYSKRFLKPKKVRRVIRKVIPRPILKIWYRFRGVKV